jgi:hypothetical protein
LLHFKSDIQVIIVKFILDDYIKSGSDEKSVRMIFDKVSYDDYENKIIEKMKKEIKDKNITIPL